MRRVAILGLGGLLLAGTSLAQEAPAGDRAEGRKLAGQCRTCHGLDGYARIPIAPHIGGEPADYIAAQLTAFRAGTRVHEMMSVVAKSLTDAQIADLAAWYAGHVPTVATSADPAQAPEACVACHGTDGIAVAEHVPNLAGETNIYIDTQLKAFRTGKRTHEIMSAIAADLTDDEIRAAADWYAAVRLTVTQTD
jgi:cytochrome c553